ncbi:MAG: ATP-dependent helicase, partial [Nocardiopsaceae bacterium]|nr:ATP-dependent helicase [Nocardiopsaceae bacterium]
PAREVRDHGAQVALAARIAARHPQVGAGESGRYPVVLLDEYQDTSHAQLMLLRALFGGGHPVTAVGDPCQSIYGWRGASAGNLRRFATDFRDRRQKPSSVRKLSTSFRNAGRVLDAAAVLQADLRAQAPDVPVLVPAPDRGDRGGVTCALLPTIGEEADWVAARAAELLALPAGTAPDGRPWPESPGADGRGGTSPGATGYGADGRGTTGRGVDSRGATGRGAGVRPSDIAVLCRKRSQFVPLRRAFEARGIGCEVVGLGGLLSVPEVRDVVATLRVLHDASASDALARLLTGPRWRIGPRDLVALGRRARTLAGGAPPGEAPPGGAPSGETPSGEGPPGGDALAEALTDLTADTGSLVEALDDLGDPDGYSPVGYRRLTALAEETRRLRAHVSRPLADLVAEVEQTLSLDIEVAARPGADPGAARADLDAFADVAATFAGDQPDPTLGAFLAYLSAAEQEEFGLEPGRVGESDTVKLLTVHAAKGLQWPAVFIPGLAAGEKSQVFPARPRQSTRWTDNPRLIPFGLRGDTGDLPSLRDLSAEEIDAFTEACADRDLAEERRLAYVAATRAAFWLGCSGYWWGEGTVPLGPSAFLTEVRRACLDGAGTVGPWAAPPPEGAENPLLATVEEAEWPLSEPARHHEATWFAGHLVRAAVKPFQPLSLTNDPASPAPASSSLSPEDRELVAAWERDAGLLLAERERQRRRGDGPVPVVLPSKLSVSALVMLARDPDELARQVRRPMPRPPAVAARRGTEFHRWLEERFGQQRLIGDDDLFPDPPEDDPSLADLKARFEAGEWGGRWPREVEVPFDTRIGDRQVRGRIDAVFA